jgi:uncharacterized protein (DUF1330 family)
MAATMPSAGKRSPNFHSLNFHSRLCLERLSASRGSVQIFMKEKVMKATSKMALAMVAGFALGATAVQTLYAQAKPPGYAIVEVNVTDENGFTSEFLPLVAKDIQAAGGKYVVRGGNPVTLQGAPPTSRVVVLQFESAEKVQAWWNSPSHRAAESVAAKYANTRAFAVEGTAP